MIIEPKDTNFYSTDTCKMQMYSDLLQSQKEIERLNDRIKRLEEAGDRLDSQIYCSCGMKIGCNDCEDAKSHWHKTKEAKP